MLDSSVFLRLSFPLLFFSTSDAGRLSEGGGAKVAGKSPNELLLFSSSTTDSLKESKIFSSGGKLSFHKILIKTKTLSSG